MTWNAREPPLGSPAEYEALKRPQRNQSVDDWANRFRKVWNEAKLLNLPIVYKDRPQADFLNAVRVWEECGYRRGVALAWPEA